jgi:lysozyme
MASERQMLVDQLIRHEGLRLKPYMDSVGKITIGVGRNLSDVGISQREAMDLLDHDVDEAVADLAGSFPWFVSLDHVRQRVMIDMRFNLGPTRFRVFKRMLRAMAEQDYPKAASAMRDSVWFQQVKTRGVRLVQMMLTGQDA